MPVATNLCPSIPLGSITSSYDLQTSSWFHRSFLSSATTAVQLHISITYGQTYLFLSHMSNVYWCNFEIFFQFYTGSHISIENLIHMTLNQVMKICIFHWVTNLQVMCVGRIWKKCKSGPHWLESYIQVTQVWGVSGGCLLTTFVAWKTLWGFHSDQTNSREF